MLVFCLYLRRWSVNIYLLARAEADHGVLSGIVILAGESIGRSVKFHVREKETNMNRHILFLAMMTGVLLVMLPQSVQGQVSEDVADQNDVNSVIIALTRLDVNDTKLELSYKIKNNTDHDVWICDDIIVETDPNFEVYLSKEERSLIIRRRLDVPTVLGIYARTTGRYVLLRPEQERTESVSFAVPVVPHRVFELEV